MGFTHIGRGRRGPAAAIVLTMLTASVASAGEVRFTISNPAPLRVATVVRVSLPVPEGFIAGEAPAKALVGGRAARVPDERLGLRVRQP